MISIVVHMMNIYIHMITINDFCISYDFYRFSYDTCISFPRGGDVCLQDKNTLLN